MKALKQILEETQLQKAQAQTNSLIVSKPTSALTSEEEKVVQLKYAGKQFGEMSPEDLFTWSKTLLLKIHVITGWTIPEKEILTILLDQFQKKITENYPTLNAEEVEYAFRSKGTVIEDWGKAMNLNLLDKVLLPYLDNRFRISETERQLNYYKRRPEFNLENDIDWRKMIEEDYEFFLSGKNLSTFPHKYYDILVEDKFFEPDIYAQFVNVETKEQDAKDEAIMLLFRTARAKNFKNLYVRHMG
jgi:hypothetical protein